MKTPKELEFIWDPKIKEAWDAMKPKQQAFFVKWLNNGFNATQAYWDTYDKTANANSAGACGSRILRSANIQKIARKLAEEKGTDLMRIKKVYNDAMQASTPIFADGEKVMDIEDHKIRITAAEKLARLNGELVDKIDNTHRFPEPVIFQKPDGEIYKRITFDNAND
ncbi:terminase small subunit [Magnetococcales bacterium HHB-1]